MAHLWCSVQSPTGTASKQGCCREIHCKLKSHLEGATPTSSHCEPLLPPLFVCLFYCNWRRFFYIALWSIQVSVRVYALQEKVQLYLIPQVLAKQEVPLPAQVLAVKVPNLPV